MENMIIWECAASLRKTKQFGCKSRWRPHCDWSAGSLSFRKPSNFAEFQEEASTEHWKSCPSHQKTKQFYGNHADLGMRWESAENQAISIQNEVGASSRFCGRVKSLQETKQFAYFPCICRYRECRKSQKSSGNQAIFHDSDKPQLRWWRFSAKVFTKLSNFDGYLRVLIDFLYQESWKSQKSSRNQAIF